MHESQLHDHNCFVTLTYSDKYFHPSLNHKDWQDFAKRTRAKLGPFSYYMVGEYGERFLRPHFHACLFGLDFTDKFPFKKSDSGGMLYTSDTLDELWPWGFANIAELTFELAAYAARYMMEKPTTPEARKKAYQRVDGDTGELTNVIPEYNRMSLKPAIGKRWIEKYGITDCFAHDHIITNGQQAKPPRYYDKQLEKIDKEQFDKIKKERKEKAKLNQADNKPQRLKVKEHVAKAKLKLKKRGLE